MREIEFIGKIILTGDILTETGLFIGGFTPEGEIWGLDKAVLRNPVTGLPYLPGSSIKGKLRYLLERELDKPLNKSTNGKILHECTSEEEYNTCPVCKLFGVRSRPDWSNYYTRLILRDVPLAPEKTGINGKKLAEANLDFPWTEIKWEATIDRINGSVLPRQQERVPAGAVFSPFEVIINLFQPEDIELVYYLARSLQLLEDDYLGGGGSRGYGKIRFHQLEVKIHSKNYREFLLPLQHLLSKQGAVPLSNLAISSLSTVQGVIGRFKPRVARKSIKTILEKWFSK